MKHLPSIFYFTAIISITSCAHSEMAQETGDASKQGIRCGVITRISRLEPECPLKTDMLTYPTGVNRDGVPERNGAASVAAGAVFATTMHFGGEMMGVRDRFRITVKLNNGALVSVVQKVRYTESFNEGDHVKVRGTFAVSH